MKTINRCMGLLVCLFLAAVVMVPPSSAADAPAMVVGRIYHIEGDLFRYVPDERDWVAVVKDAPFSTEDTLFSDSRGMAELIVPNGTWVRIGNSTQIQFITLEADLAEIDVASGVARFFNKSSDTVVKVTSPFGYVLSYPGTVFDFYVGENSVEAVAIEGKVSFVPSATDARYNVEAGSTSILADWQHVSPGEGTVDRDWDRWNTVRENYWAAKARVRGRSAEYLPPSLQDESYALDENGSWERVRYEGSYRWFWRPRVVVGWSPFTVGRWTDWYGDQTWIPAEPFGYVTHHYGNWIYVRNYWYWAPPVVSVRVGFPLLDVGFYWYPGRVSWIHSGIYVGWVVLAPQETYYSHRHWGDRHAVVVTNVNITQININVRNYAYAGHAVVVNRDKLYRVNNYRDVREKNVNRTTIINNYNAAPVVNNTVINNYTTNKQRYNYTDVTVKEKPHNAVINRIEHNETTIKAGTKEKAVVVQERVKSIPEGKVNREARIETPKVTNYIVPAADVSRPKSEIKLQQKEIKTSVKPVQQEKSGARSERVAPVTTGQQEKPGQSVEKETEKSRGRSPAEKGAEATKEVKPQEKAESARPAETVKTPESRVVEKPRVANPAGTGAEAAKEVKPQEKAESARPTETVKTPEGRAVENPRVVNPARTGAEAAKEVKPQEKAESARPAETVRTPEGKAMESPRVVNPARTGTEATKEVKPQEKAESARPAETARTPEGRAVEKPRVINPARTGAEATKEVKPQEKAKEQRLEQIQTQIEKLKKQPSSEKNSEKQKELKGLEEEAEKLKKSMEVL